jgi:hypothetical protein
VLAAQFESATDVTVAAASVTADEVETVFTAIYGAADRRTSPWC